MNILNQSCGLYIIFGPMFSGKTTELLRIISTAQIVNIKCLYINHSKDTRSNDKFSTHNALINCDHDFNKIQIPNLHDFINQIKNYDLICIDEFQFFNNHSDIETILQLINDFKKTVIIAALNGDSNRQLFGLTYKLIPHADKIETKHAICSRCIKNKKIIAASFTYKTVKNNDQICIGGKQFYKPLCRECRSLKN